MQTEPKATLTPLEAIQEMEVRDLVDNCFILEKVDFNSDKIKMEMRKVEAEIKAVMDGAKIDREKMHITFHNMQTLSLTLGRMVDEKPEQFTKLLKTLK